MWESEKPVAVLLSGSGREKQQWTITRVLVKWLGVRLAISLKNTVKTYLTELGWLGLYITLNRPKQTRTASIIEPEFPGIFRTSEPSELFWPSIGANIEPFVKPAARNHSPPSYQRQGMTCRGASQGERETRRPPSRHVTAVQMFGKFKPPTF